ncbi:MAG: crossover junction endodeoxyribonuclease RuvC [Oscillospiraceae bacterium]|nr:crossover junction endodeoxyribonuclease RuvC [Oscillospiraceae bacterium]
MVIVGIDPGYAIVGVGIVKYAKNKLEMMEYGAITTQAHTKTTQRLGIIYEKINEVFDLYKPDAVAVEELFFNSNAKTAISVAQARGVLLVSAANKGIPVYEYTPLQIKQAITGYGRADKQQMQQMVKMLLNLNVIPKPDDAADALAVGICHAHSYGTNSETV